MRDVRGLGGRLVENVERVIYGKRDGVRQALVALLAGGHLLLEDVPGVGKTMLAKALARTVGGSFKRIQFTPDLLPADVTGVTLYEPQTGLFRFRPGPVFCNLLLADEINRASPKTQSALLESMAEETITIDGEMHAIPQPFMVIATQNPVEMEGVYPLPEAQLDRFMMRLRLGYPGREHERNLLDLAPSVDPGTDLEPVADPNLILECQQRVREVYLDAAVQDYLLDLVEASRTHEQIRLGASPRAAVALSAAARAAALLDGRDYVTPADVHQLAIPVLAHRLLLEPSASLNGAGGRHLVGELLTRVKAP